MGEAMKLRWMVVLIVGVLCVQVGCAGGGASVRAPAATKAGEEPVLETQSAQEPLALETQKDKESYAIGVETGRNFRRQAMDVDPELVTRGMNDALRGDKLLLTDEELLDAMNTATGKLIVERGRNRLIAAQDNKKEGEAFLAANKTKEGVVTLPSGLQYKIMNAGEGKKPTEADTVECYYRGTLINGTEFDSVSSPMQPATFRLSDPNLIPGFREALKLMPVGSKWHLFIPSQLAYGQRGAGGVIGPYATLIFEVELVAIK
jgi:FKBP-type peptidyl-prolyl cis-trans isomerase FklB